MLVVGGGGALIPDAPMSIWRPYVQMIMTTHPFFVYCTLLLQIMHVLRKLSETIKQHSPHGLINYIDIKAKYRHLKKLTWKGTSQQVFIRVIDWWYSQSCWCWYFRPALWTVASLTFSLHHCVNTVSVQHSTVYMHTVCKGEGGMGS